MNRLDEIKRKGVKVMSYEPDGMYMDDGDDLQGQDAFTQYRDQVEIEMGERRQECDDLKAQLAKANASVAVLVETLKYDAPICDLCTHYTRHNCGIDNHWVMGHDPCSAPKGGFKPEALETLDQATKDHIELHEAMKEEHEVGLGNDKECCYDDACCDCDPVCWNCKLRVASKKVEDIRNRKDETI